MFDGECLADVLFSQGHREAYLGSTEVESGTSAGAVAHAQSLHVPGSDHATDADLRAAGACGGARSRRAAEGAFDYTTHGGEGLGGIAQGQYDWVPKDPKDRNSHDEEGAGQLFGGLFRPSREKGANGPEDPGDSGGGYVQACDGVRGGLLAEAGLDTSHGSTGPDPDGPEGPEGPEGYPTRRAECVDFGDDPGSERTTDGPAGAFTSEVACDAAVPEGEAGSSTAGWVLPSTEDPVVVVRSATSSMDSYRTVEDGKAYQVTESRAEATGVQIGTVALGAVSTTAVVRAGGLKGTTRADLTREWCDVTVGGTTLAQGCHVVTPGDPLVAQVTDELRQAFPRLRLSVPQASAEATPGGAQAVVIKDEGLRITDDAVNDDDSILVSALEIVFVNDGAEGRNRWVVQLAGVEAEARYAINVLPSFESSGGSGSSFTSTKATPSTRRVVPGRKSLPRASTLVEGEAFDALLTGDTAAPSNPAQRFVTWVPNAIKDLLRLLIQHPLEFALLFLVFSLLATPPYLAYRRRVFTGVVAR